ncbi:aldolase [Planotetraspora silvatica]|uniref:Aldolase n=1 Tax=Planotetraspora silvatica TaxID=234614 RepID=A0A8J3XPM9_9ACTN|nr:hypothetical protein [Planotetraspora silvatica]GII47571.1 aldolase [Planotetraspora silvatica]
MPGLGTAVRLNRIFSNPSGRFFSVAVDHFVGYPRTMQDGLRDLPSMVKTLVDVAPDAITMFAGSARAIWMPYAGTLPLIVQAGCFTPDDRVMEVLATPEDALRLGADAIALAIGVRGPNEGTYLRYLDRTVAAAEKLELPVIAHIYPRSYVNGPEIVTDAEDIAWAARCGIECGADVIKIAYTGSIDSFAEIVDSSPRPIVVAGGLRTSSLHEALTTANESLKAGAVGLTVGRNVWGHDDPAAVAKAFKSVIHDGVAVDDAL